MNLARLMTMFLAMNLPELEAAGQTTGQLDCGPFTREPREVIVFNTLTLPQQNETLNRFLSCVETDARVDIDGLYFMPDDPWTQGDHMNGLMAATFLGLNDVARSLIHNYADINARSAPFLRTALHVAAKKGNLNMLKILTDLGANVNAVTSTGGGGRQPLFYSLWKPAVSILLARGAEVNARSVYGNSAMHQTGNTDIITILLANGADINQRDGNGWTPLMKACRNNQRSVVAFLLSRGANKYIADNQGFKPILFCRRYAIPL